MSIGPSLLDLVPILFVNGKRSGTRVRGRARVRAPAWIAKEEREERAAGRRVEADRAARNADRTARGLSPLKKRKRRQAYQQRGRRARRSEPVMAKRRKRRARTATVRPRRRRAASAAPKRRRRRRRAASAAPKRRRRRRRALSSFAKRNQPSPRRRRRRRAASAAPKRRRRRRRAAPTTVKIRRRRRRPAVGGTVMMGPSRTIRGYAVKSNPGRRRRRRGRARPRRARRAHRGHRRYRRNPGMSMIVDLAKQALPALAGFYATRLIAAKIGPMVPGVSSLGSLQGPVVAAGAVFGLGFLTQKVAALATHRSEIMIGAMTSLLDQLISAFAPASVKTMIGMSDYVQMGDYIAIGATPLNDRMTLSDYVAIGSDGVEEELGLEEELGVEEELGNDMLGGVAGGASLMKRVPSQQFVSPVPARSFSQQVPPAGGAYDSPDQLYGGIFGGGFGGR